MSFWRHNRSLVQQQSGGGAAGALAEYIGAGTAFFSTASGAVAAPVDSLAGDMLVLVSLVIDNQPALTAPTDWTERVDVSWSTAMRLHVWTRVAAGDGAANDATVGAATRQQARMIAIRGVTAFTAVQAGVNGDAGYSLPGGAGTAFQMPQFTPGGDVKYKVGVSGTYRVTGGDPGASTWSDFSELVRQYNVSGSVDRILRIAGQAGSDATANPTTVSPSYTGGPVGAILSFT